MALPPRGERLPSEMNEGTDYGHKGHKGSTYGLGALGLLGPSPSAQFYSILFYTSADKGLAICDISCTDGLCDNRDGGGSSSGEEVGNKHDLESVMSFAQAHTANETAKSFSHQHSNGTRNKQNTFNSELMLFPNCETFIFCFLLFLTRYWFSHNCHFPAFIICPPHTFQERSIEVSLHSICCAANFLTK
jgi:hypothetical protein